MAVRRFPSSPAGGAGSSRRPPPRPVEKSHIDPAKWSPEVIQALCQRLPGGRLTVTVKCQACNSHFYPCLCPPSPADNCKLRAPRVVELAESRRLQPSGQTHKREVMGNLGLVKQFARTPGVDKHRLVLLGAKDPEMDEYIRSRHPEHRKGTVVFRRGPSYVLKLVDQPSWVQDLRFSPQELRELSAILDDDLKVFEAPVLKTIAVEYESEEDARGDIELVRMPGLVAAGAPASEAAMQTPLQPCDAFHVNDLRAGGRACAAGVRCGHVLHELQRLVPEGRGQLGWHRVAADELLPGPFTMITEPATEDGHGEAWTPRRRPSQPAVGAPKPVVGPRSQQKPGLCPWPWRLVFNALPAGWRAVSELASNASAGAAGASAGGHKGGHKTHLTVARLAELAEGTQDVTLRFERTPYTVISRSGLVVRHDHTWDGECLPSRKADVEMLREWGTKSRMTPSQLSFAFKRIREVLSNELREFEFERKMIEKMILDKARHYIDTLRLLNEDDSIRGEERKALERELEGQKTEIRNVLEQVPLYFAAELSEACTRPVHHAPRLQRSPSAPMPPGQLGKERAPSAHRAAKTCRNLMAMLMQQRSLAVSTSGASDSGPRSPLRSKSRSRSLSASLKCSGAGSTLDELNWEVLDFVKEEADHFLQGSRAATLLHTSGRTATCRDGRLTLNDFKKILLDAGICWLSEEDIRSKFRALDVDDSGYLTMGEILEVTQRIEELLRQLRDYEEERRLAGAAPSHAELIEEFSTKLLLGDDLVGPMSRKALPDGSITASSYHLRRPDHGRGQMWRSRLDCMDTPWTADAADREPWIQWNFRRLMLITAVLTRGHPGKDVSCWVTNFRLEHATNPNGPWHECGDFEGNSDRSTTACNELTEPVRATVVRLRPTAWVPSDRGAALRATLLGFPADAPGARGR